MTKQQTLIRKFSGLNQSISDTEDSSFRPDMLNFRITDKYELKKRDGFTAVAQHKTPIRGMWCGEIAGVKQIVYVTGGTVYSIDIASGKTSLCGNIEDGKTNLFSFGGMLYIQNGVDYYRYDGVKIESVEGHIPIISISTPPEGGGTPYETVNMLNDKRRQLFSGDFNVRLYVLAEKELNEIVSVKVGGKVTNQYETDLAAGTIEFFTPQPSGINNIEITYRKESNLRQKIIKCSHAMLFGSNADTRVFMWGNSDYPAYRFHSDLAEGVPSAEYFPELNYTAIGSSNLTDIVQQYDRQLIFTPDSAYYSYCEVRTDSSGKVFSSFPVFSLNSSKGNLIPASGCAINCRPVTLCRDGINCWESTNIENEKNAVCFSAPIANVIRQIQSNNGWNECRLFDFQGPGELYFAYNSILYIYNYKLGVWYAYDGVTADVFCDCYGELYIAGTDNTIYKYDSTNKNHTAVWTSDYLNFSEPCNRKDISSAVITTAVEDNTELTISCTDGEEQDGMEVTQTFSLPYNGTTYLAARKLRISMRRVQSARIKITCGPGKALVLKSIGIITQKKGEAEYGI